MIHVRFSFAAARMWGSSRSGKRRKNITGHFDLRQRTLCKNRSKHTNFVLTAHWEFDEELSRVGADEDIRTLRLAIGILKE